MPNPCRLYNRPLAGWLAGWLNLLQPDLGALSTAQPRGLLLTRGGQLALTTVWQHQLCPQPSPHPHSWRSWAALRVQTGLSKRQRESKDVVTCFWEARGTTGGHGKPCLEGEGPLADCKDPQVFIPRGKHLLSARLPAEPPVERASWRRHSAGLSP